MKNNIKRLFILIIVFILVSLHNICLASVVQRPNKPELLSVNLNNNVVTLKWQQVQNVDGYKIYMSTSKNGNYTKIKTIQSGKRTYYNRDGFSEDKEYYFKVKAFITNKEERVLSQASNIKSVGGVIAKINLTSTSNDFDRNINLAVACKKVDQTILNKGQNFRWSKVVGNPTILQGYRKGIAYANGNNVLAVGGGICQVSTALYQCAKQANMKIIERHEHGKDITYIEQGEDATVEYGRFDLAFKNKTGYKIKIRSYSDKNTVICQFYKIGN